MEEQQEQNQEEQPKIVVEQPKKNIIPTRLGSLIILLTATIAGAGVWWYAGSYAPPEVVDVNGIVEQIKEGTEMLETKIVNVSFPNFDTGEKYSSPAGRYYKGGEIFFTNSDGKLISKINGSKLKDELDKYKPDGPLKISSNAIETIGGSFYFFIGGRCGRNCGWRPFKFDSINQELLYIGNINEENKDYENQCESDDLGGSIGNYYLSSDKKKVAVISGSWGGGCYHTDEISILNLEKDSFQVTNSNEYTNKEYTINEVDFLEWVDDNCFTFSLNESNCSGNEPVFKEIRYCVYTNKFEILETKTNKKILACLAPDTKILMSDGSYENIEDIKVGDTVTSYDIKTKEYTTSKVDKVIKRKDPLVIINNTLRAAPDEPVYSASGSIKEAADIKVGDYLVNEKGEQVKVNTIERNTELVDTYDFTLENGDNFFADGYLVATPDL